MADLLADGLTLGVRLANEGQVYEFGVVWQGVFVPVGGRKVGGFDRDAEAVKLAAAQPTSPAPPVPNS